MGNDSFDRPRVLCECEDCGKKFYKGTEGDNERFCLRCDHLSRRARMEENGDEYDDRDDRDDEGGY